MGYLDSKKFNAFIISPYLLEYFSYKEALGITIIFDLYLTDMFESKYYFEHYGGYTSKIDKNDYSDWGFTPNFFNNLFSKLEKINVLERYNTLSNQKTTFFNISDNLYDLHMDCQKGNKIPKKYNDKHHFLAIARQLRQNIIAFHNIEGFLKIIDKRFYILEEENNSKYYKLGYTSNIKQRLQTHQTSNPHNLFYNFHCSHEQADILEQAIHAKYAKNRVRDNGEWFELTKKDLKNIYSDCFNANKTIEIYQASLENSRTDKVLLEHRDNYEYSMDFNYSDDEENIPQGV